MKKPRINNQILAKEVRVIDDEGGSPGVFEISKALEMAKEKGLDLIEISPNAVPPVAKIMDYGKFLYKEKRKARGTVLAGQVMELKGIRIHLGTSAHDLMLKAKKIGEFLNEGHRMRIELFLKGREKGLDRGFLAERLKRILNLIPENYKIAEDIKPTPRGMYIIIEKGK
ncbi:MAG: translation initiation factor IF-3 [bacterium]|nr:translation initiation factor IF-3 [bacterium]